MGEGRREDVLKWQEIHAIRKKEALRGCEGEERDEWEWEGWRSNKEGGVGEGERGREKEREGDK